MRLFLSIREYNKHFLNDAEGGRKIIVKNIINEGIMKNNNLVKNFFMSQNWK
jgi:hypothetical protein